MTPLNHHDIRLENTNVIIIIIIISYRHMTSSPIVTYITRTTRGRAHISNKAADVAKLGL